MYCAYVIGIVTSLKRCICCPVLSSPPHFFLPYPPLPFALSPCLSLSLRRHLPPNTHSNTHARDLGRNCRLAPSKGQCLATNPIQQQLTESRPGETISIFQHESKTPSAIPEQCCIPIRGPNPDNRQRHNFVTILAAAATSQDISAYLKC